MIQDIHFWWQIFLIFVYQNYCRQHDRRQVKLSLMYAHRSLCLKNSPKQGGERPCVLGNYYMWLENEPIAISFLFITGHVLFTREASIYFGKCWKTEIIRTLLIHFYLLREVAHHDGHLFALFCASPIFGKEWPKSWHGLDWFITMMTKFTPEHSRPFDAAVLINSVHPSDGFNFFQ